MRTMELNDMRSDRRGWDLRCWVVVGSMWSFLAIATEATPAAVPSEFLTCYGIKRTGERLACYDRAVEYLRAGDRVDAPSAEASFGLQASESRKKESASDAEETTSVTGRVTEISSSRDGMRIITLDNGQTWRQITGATVFLNVGDEVTVNRGALGSFLMRIPNGGPLRVRRIE